MNITNIKCHVRLENSVQPRYQQSLQESEAVSKRTPSFVVLRLPPFVYTCFYSGFINITGVRDFDQVEVAIATILDRLRLDPEAVWGEPQVDSISSCWPKTQPLPAHKLNRVYSIASKDSEIVALKLNREQFPALFLKTQFGTLLWFNSPAVVSVGSKKKEDLQALKEIVDRILLKLSLSNHEP